MQKLDPTACKVRGRLTRAGRASKNLSCIPSLGYPVTPIYSSALFSFVTHTVSIMTNFQRGWLGTYPRVSLACAKTFRMNTLSHNINQTIMGLAPRAPPIASPLRQGSLCRTICHTHELQLSTYPYLSEFIASVPIWYTRRTGGRGRVVRPPAVSG